MTKEIQKEVILPVQSSPKRVDAALAEIFHEFSRAQLTQWLKEGLITINQKSYKPKEKVFGGEKIMLCVTPSAVITDEGENIPLTIVYEDQHIIIVNKPVGMVVHPGAGNPRHTLVNALLHHQPHLSQLPRAGIIHRLDKDTSGLLIVAKTLEAHTQLIKQMQERAINRQYLALVYGHLISGGLIETYYGRDSKNRLKMAVCTHGKEAVTEFFIKKQYQRFTLLDVKLYTGRTHQIRVHLNHIRHPIVGDLLYGGRPRVPPKASVELKTFLQQFKRQALHAYFLSFDHPITEEALEFNAPIPEDFKTLLTLLDENLENFCS